ncbi:uncharacterized protein LOC110759389 [Prunus avium]|uniref:Uncharacterized protein LOC110759389 n=1 Tax=Prunus avium TaxID=42229 RepID=A0A6P5SU02_PRUAV|nr:uncharacterized protein LOC110759389 [Prunus avium]
MKESARATLREAYSVSTRMTVPNGRGTDKPDDPRDEAVTPQAQPIEDLESVTLSEAQSDRQVRISTTLSSALRADFITFLRANTEVFAWSYNDMLGIAPHVISHKLSICPTFKPIRQKWRPYDTEWYEAMRLEVTYPIWLANSVLVKKSSGAWRMCQDYTDLNKACPKDSFPLPRINQMVDAIAGHELLSFMDAYSGYNQIFMSPADREHMAFITDKGLYCYNVMPFGLKNAGATYQRLVNKIFSELIGTSMEVYVDDMLVKSKTADSHLHNLSIMFDVLKKYNMRLNPNKCAFGVSSGKFLGFMINQQGIEDNPEKIKALLDMQIPKTHKDIQSLIGRVAALARFISKATDRCAPFFKALKGSKRQIVWTAECDRAFQDLKTYMSRAPLLSTPLPGEELIFYLSVSATALSSVLIRKPNGIELQIFYNSHALQDAEIRYPELEKLAYALVLSARKLRPYFQAHSITVLTNQPLRQILQRPEMSGRLVKWAIELSEFDIHYHPRPAEKDQAVADFISEMTTFEKEDPDDDAPGPASAAPVAHPTEGTFNPSIPLWTLYVDGSSNRQGSGAGLVLKAPDQTTIEYAIRFQFQASNNEAEYKALLAGLRLAKGIGAKQLRICSDSQLVVNQVLTEFEAKDTSMAAYLTHARRLLQHFAAYQVQQIPRSENSHADALSRLASAIDDNVGRHVPIEILARRSTSEAEVHAVQQDPSWMDPIHAFLASGTLPDDKTKAKTLHRRSARYLLLNQILYRRGHSLPLLRCMTPQQGNYVLREIHEGACGDHSGARSLAFKTIRQGYYWPTLHADATKLVQSLPNAIITDNGKQFDSSQFRHLCHRFKINLFFASPAHPQSNGQVEAINKIIKKTLKKKLGPAKGAWPDLLPKALWAINTSYRRSTSETPFSLAFGTEAVVPVEINAPTCRTASYTPEQNETLLAFNLDLIDEHCSQAQVRNAAYKPGPFRYYDSRVKRQSFKLGDWVLRKVSLATKDSNEGTLGPTWESPYEVVTVCRPGTYRLRGTDGHTLGHPWNVEHLKYYYK